MVARWGLASELYLISDVIMTYSGTGSGVVIVHDDVSVALIASVVLVRKFGRKVSIFYSHYRNFVLNLNLVSASR